MRLIDKPLRDLLAAFRSPDPTPGGGSASALAGAVGASLLAMVAGLPKPRATSSDENERLRAAGRLCSGVSESLGALVDRDSDAYDGVVAAYRLPKETEEQKAERSRAIQQALRAATETPLDVMRGCATAIEQAAVVASLGNRNASSDVQVAIQLLSAGLRGAGVNVEINLGSINDQNYTAEVRQEAQRVHRVSEAAAAAARQALETG